MAGMKIHRRQFVITSEKAPAALEALPDFKTRKLFNNVYLHHDAELLVEQTADGLILGRQIRPDDGRYVKIDADGWLSLDATGSLGIHYLEQGGLLASSSPTLLALFSRRPLTLPKKFSQLSWMPAPYGPVDGSKRLFCDQALNLISGGKKTIVRPRFGEQTIESAATLLAKEGVESVKALAESGKPIYLALTGGQDSRTIFAALVAAKVPFEAFTLRLSDGASAKDARLASLVCKPFGIKHSQFRRAWLGASARRKRYLQHSGGIDGDRGRDYAAGNYYRSIPDGAIVLHGGSVALNKVAFEIPEPKRVEHTACQIVDSYAAAQGPIDLKQRQALSAWVEYRERHPIGHINDQFFLDQRRACWGSDNRFAEDVFGFEWVLFANSWRLIDCFWSVPMESRRTKEIPALARELMVPGIGQRTPPVNPPQTRSDIWRGRFSKRGLNKAIRRFRNS